jgi:hypothetical protein
VAQIAYVGTRAYHLWNHEASDLNQPLQVLDTNFCGPDPSNCISNFGRRYFNQQPNMTAVLPLDYPQLQMFYNAFQASLNKRFANGFNFLAAYTFAKNLGNADGNTGGFIQFRAMGEGVSVRSDQAFFFSGKQDEPDAAPRTHSGSLDGSQRIHDQRVSLSSVSQQRQRHIHRRHQVRPRLTPETPGRRAATLPILTAESWSSHGRPDTDRPPNSSA